MIIRMKSQTDLLEAIKDASRVHLDSCRAIDTANRCRSKHSDARVYVHSRVDSDSIARLYAQLLERV